MSGLSVVIPHWPLDEEVDESLRRCLRSLPRECEKIVVVNDGTGFGRNVNIGLKLATGGYVAVVGNDSRLVRGDVHDLCVPETVTSPVVVGKPSIDAGGFHGAFWVVPRPVLDRVGLLDEGFEGAFFEDDDFLARLKEAQVEVTQITSVWVESRRVGLTMSKLPQEKVDEWYERNERRFEQKWGWMPPAYTVRYRRPTEGSVWHFCQSCSEWPTADYEEQVLPGPLWDESLRPHGTCPGCSVLYEDGTCAF